jgi:hypothetical protein
MTNETANSPKVKRPNSIKPTGISPDLTITLGGSGLMLLEGMNSCNVALKRVIVRTMRKRAVHRLIFRFMPPFVIKRNHQAKSSSEIIKRNHQAKSSSEIIERNHQTTS